MRPTPKPDHIHVVVNLNTNERNKGEFWASKYIGANGSKGSRFKFWQINSRLEIIGKAKTISWDDEWTGQTAQLQAALDKGFKVLEQYEAMQAAWIAYDLGKVGHH